MIMDCRTCNVFFERVDGFCTMPCKAPKPPALVMPLPNYKVWFLVIIVGTFGAFSGFLLGSVFYLVMI